MAMIPLNEIAPDPNNVRIGPPPAEKDADLLASVRQQGVLMPILVRPHPDGMLRVGEAMEPAPPYMVVAGHRRHAAAVAAGLKAIPAEIREFANEADVALAQMAENTRRADMHMVDVWAAVERAAALGLSDDAIALAMNRTKRGVAQFRVMGRLHEDLKAHIRATGNMPPDHNLRIIAQADQERQAASFAEVVRNNGASHYNFWPNVAAALTVKRIPLAYARFDRKLYDGRVFNDVFAEDGLAEQAQDVAQFLRLQTEWMGDECGRRNKQGFADAVVLAHDKYGLLEPPTGATKYVGHRPLPDRLPKKAYRAGIIYSVSLETSGEVRELLWDKAPEKTAAERREAPALGTPPKPVDPVLAAFTKKGAEELEKHKRRALAEGMDGPPRRDLQGTCIALLALLHEQVSGYKFGVTGLPQIGDLMAEDGRLNPLLPEERVTEFAQALIAYTGKAKATLRTVELVGDFLEVPSLYPTDPEALKHIKGPGLKQIAAKLGFRDGTFSTQAKLREAIGKALVQIGPEHLPVVGWKVEPKPAMHVRQIGGTRARNQSDVFASRGDEEETPEPPDMTEDELRGLLALPEREIDFCHDELRDELVKRGVLTAPEGGEWGPEQIAVAGEELRDDARAGGEAEEPSAEQEVAADLSEHNAAEDLASAEAARALGIDGPDDLGPEHADADLRAPSGPPAAAFEAWKL